MRTKIIITLVSIGVLSGVLAMCHNDPVMAKCQETYSRDTCEYTLNR